jgi:hypothetical protein
LEGATVVEKRKHERLEYGVELDLFYYQDREGHAEIVNKLHTEDVSAGGARVLVPAKLGAGAVIWVKLYMPYTGREVECIALVMWVVPAGEDMFDTGLAFSNLSEEETLAISRLVRTEMDKKVNSLG